MTTTTLVETSGVPVKHGRSLVLFLAKLLVAAGLLTWLFSSGRLDFSSLLKIHHWEYIWLAGGMLLLSMVLPVWRWHWLLQMQQLRMGWLTALRMTWLGYFATVFLPGAAGGDLAKAYTACRHQPKAKMRAVSTVFVDRAFGLHSLLFIGSVTGLHLLARGCTSRQANVIWLTIICLGIASAGLFLLLWRRSSRLALRLLPRRFQGALAASLESYRQARRQLLAIWLYSVLCNVSSVSSYILVAVALGGRANLTHTMAIPLVIVANSVPVSPGGLGVGETAGSQLFREFGLADGGLIVLLVRLGTIVFSVPGVIGILGRTDAKKTAVETCL